MESHLKPFLKVNAAIAFMLFFALHPAVSTYAQSQKRIVLQCDSSLQNLGNVVFNIIDSVAKPSKSPTNAPKETLSDKYVPSPETYSIMQYNEIPVSLYSGVPTISIPLYTVKAGLAEVPISLNYHASGIKVSQEASRVGLGWSLHAGGIISRTVRDKDDFTYNYAESIDPLKYSGQGWMIYDNGSQKRLFDCEPDIFRYNFGKYSGKFYLVKPNGKLQDKYDDFIISDVSHNIKVEYNKKDKFIITTPDNVKYFFTEEEIHANYGMGNEYKDNVFIVEGIPSKTSLYYPPTFSNSSERAASWHLTKIAMPDGHTIDFKYNVLGNSYMSPVFITDIKRKLLATDHCYSEEYMKNEFGKGADERCKNTKSFSITDIKAMPELESITWDMGKIVFEPERERRTDIMPYDRIPEDRNTAKALGAVKIYAKNENSPILTYRLHHSYFYGRNTEDERKPIDKSRSYLSNRLKLDSLSIIGTGYKSQKYTMGYDMSDALPIKNSTNCDRWGYYAGLTGKNVSHLDRYTTYESKQNIYHLKVSYEERGDSIETILKADLSKPIILKKGETVYPTEPLIPESAPSATTWSLNKLTDPNGSTTELKYECNKIRLQEQEWMATDSVPGFEFDKGLQNAYRDTIITFPFDRGFLDLKCVYDGGAAYKETETKIISITNVDTKEQVFSQIGIPEGLHNSGSPIHELYTFYKRVSIYKKGRYKIRLQKGPDSLYITNITLNIKTYRGKLKYAIENVGGIRVAEIKSPIYTTKFTYEDKNGECSGVLNRRSNFAYYEMYQWFLKHPSVEHEFVACTDHILVFQPSPCQPMENIFNNYFMGYTDVKVEKQGKDAKATTETYSFVNGIEPYNTSIFYVAEDLPLNGKLSKYAIYLGGKKTFEESNFYSLKECRSMLAAYNVEDKEAQFMDDKSIYHVKSFHTYKRNQSIYEYEEDGQTELSTSVAYEYNPINYMVSETRKRVGNFPERMERTIYSADCQDTELYKWLCGKNMTCLPVQTDQYVDGKLTKRKINTYCQTEMPIVKAEYSFLNKGGAMPSIHDVANASSNRYTPQMEYVSHNSCGRNTMLKDKTGRTTVLIWGYANQHVIAMVENATVDEVEACGIGLEALAQKTVPDEADWASIKALKERLKNSLVTINIYKPLVGVVERHLPTGEILKYTYDEFSRLHETLSDRTGTFSIIKSNEYEIYSEK